VILAAMALGACAPAPRGAASGPHPTFVSLNPCADAILAEVADPEQILAVSRFSHDPASSSMGVAAARAFRATSGSVEEIAALRPDVVLGDAFVGPATAGALARLGLRLERYRIEPSVAVSEAQVRRIAALAGHPERGEALVARMRAALAAAAPPPGSAPIPAVVWQSGGIVPGEGTLISDLLRRTGFTSFSAAKGLRQADLLPLERMLADPPRVIFATGDPRTEEDRLLGHPALAVLGETRRETLPSALLWCGGPTVIKAAQRLGDVREAIEASGSVRASTSSARAGHGTGPTLLAGPGKSSAQPEPVAGGAQRLHRQ
jgi:iron complex transport system substrate-binding protein